MSDNHTHSHTALLVMDVQAGIVTRFAQTGDFLERVNTAITAARAAHIPVIYVVVAFRHYQLTVLSDCCVDSDEEVQRVLLSKVFPRQAEVVTAEAWSERLKLEAGR